MQVYFSILKLNSRSFIHQQHICFSGMVHRNNVPRRVDMKEGEMRSHIKRLMSEGEKWKALKMVVLGNGCIGKTTLLRAFDQLLHPDSSFSVCYFFALFFSPRAVHEFLSRTLLDERD